MKKFSIKKALLSFILAFIISLLIFLVGVFTFLKVTAQSSGSKPSNNITGEDEDSGGFIDEKLKAPRKTNFLLIGVDQTESLTDVMIVGCFDSKTEEITLISIPRDTYVKSSNMSEELRNEMKEDNVRIPSQLKLNELHSYVGKDKGEYYLERYLEDRMGIEIDFYALVDTRAFRDIVDAVGGIDMEIRPQGYHYSDPYQNLYIDIPGGFQHLDGAMAEGVVRYRHDYALGDIDRIDIQQQFMKEFFVQVLNKDVLMENALSILGTCISYTKTNFKIAEAPKYIPYLSSFTSESINLITAPGVSDYVGDVSYFLIDDVQMLQVVNSVFYGDGLPKVDHSLDGLTIEILNGSGTSMLATEKKKLLEGVGYDVKYVGNYDGEKNEETIIYTKEGVDTTALEKLFNAPKHVIDEEITSNYDIVIILGTLEQ